MKKRFLSVVLACSLTAVSLAGCGGGGSKETQPAAAPTRAAEAGEKETAAPEAKPEASGDLSEVEKIIQEAEGMSMEELAKKAIED